ncbi:hypothetical protein VU04_11220, partial [Desulfobulbus sp. TB]|nr:hypothetical protein [Desulfobulbus sp. TB]
GVAVGMTGGVAYGVAVGVAFGVAVGVAGGVAFIFSFSGIHFYFFEAVSQWLLASLQYTLRLPTLQLAPVRYYDLSYLLHPFLTQHIIHNIPIAPELVKTTLEACDRSPGQKRVRAKVLPYLQAHEMAEQIKAERYHRTAELTGQWLPGREKAPDLLLLLADTARFLQAADKALSPYHSGNHLDKAHDSLSRCRNRCTAEDSRLAEALLASLATWQEKIDQLRTQADAEASSVLPNPFRAGDPLLPDQGMEVFRGREESIRRIEHLLNQDRASIAVLAPRRCGKTSLLNMLPLMLPDTLCVFFDLQDNVVSSPERFFQRLNQCAHEAARKQGCTDFPILGQGPCFDEAIEWFDSLESFGQEHGFRILLCIDEFERLESLFPGKRTELIRLMSLFRATIQHRRFLRLLISGVAPFDELDDIWSDHFINVREIRLTHLDQASSLALIRQPIPDFPDDAIPESVAQQIFTITNGQPFLVQLFSQLLVTRLNDQERSQATLEDLVPVEEELLEQANTYFMNMSQVPSEYKDLLKRLMNSETVELRRRERRYLRYHGLVDTEDRLAIPLLATWLLE